MSEKIDFVIGQITLSLSSAPEWVRDTLAEVSEEQFARLSLFVSEYPLDLGEKLTDEHIHKVTMALPNQTHLVDRKLYLRHPMRVSWAMLKHFGSSHDKVDSSCYQVALVLLVACGVFTPQKIGSFAAVVDRQILEFNFINKKDKPFSHSLYFKREEDALHYLADCCPGDTGIDIVQYLSR